MRTDARAPKQLFHPVTRTLVSAMLVAAAAPAQFAWSQPTVTGSPIGRQLHTVVYDEVRDALVVFGGQAVAASTTDSMFAFDIGTATWTQLAPATRPSSRRSHGMVYDSARRRVVLFGGLDVTGRRDDTWEWDGSTWTNMVVAVRPPGRQDFAMAYDSARQRAVLFGGFSDQLPSLRNDTWEWNGTAWTEVQPPSRPGIRWTCGMAYDRRRARMVLYGGSNNTVGLNDTWEYDGATWQLRSAAAAPTTQAVYAICYDELARQTVLFGGVTRAQNVPLGDTWAWDGSTWTQVAPVGPSARFGGAMAYDTLRGRSWLVGGATPTTLFADTWSLTPALPPIVATAVAYGSGCGTPPLAFVPDPGAPPIVGHVASATIANAPTLVAGVALGGSRTFMFPVPLPLDLGPIGMTGCLLWQSNDRLGLSVTPLTATTLSFSARVPLDVALIGYHVYLQAYAWAPGQNPFEFVGSNGIDWMPGAL